MTTFSEFVRAFTENNKRKLSPELRAKMSESARLSWQRRRAWVAGAPERSQEFKDAQIKEAAAIRAMFDAHNARFRK